MNNPFFPNVTLPASDHRRWNGSRRRARIKATWTHVFCCVRSTVRKSSLIAQPDWTASLPWVRGVTFWITWGFPRETRQLVYSEDYTSERTQIPVMSPLGAALVGLKVGSEIPFFTAGRTNVVKIERVSRGDPNDVVRVLFSNPEVKGKKLFDDNDPGPSAA